MMSGTIRHIREKTSYIIFEGRYAIRTSGRTDLDDLGLHTDERVYYVPANWFTLRRIVHRRDVDPDDVFIDLGSGKGRMVLEAARYPFRRVIGVELARPLHEAAQENVRCSRMRRTCRDIELVCSDVLDYQLPDDITVIFLNNPFRGAIFSSVVDKIVESYDRSPRKITLIYNNPAEDDTLMQTGRFAKKRTVRRHLKRNQTGAFGTTSVYTLGPAVSAARSA